MIDWQRLALDIRQSGTSLARADDHIGEYKGFVSQLARGEIKEPKFTPGLKLLNLHVDLCGHEKTRGLAL